MRILLIAILISLLISCSNDKPTFQLTTLPSPQEGGAIAPESGTFEQGEQLQLTAVPTKGWVFVRWEGDANGKTNPIEIILEGDVEVIAVFEEL